MTATELPSETGQENNVENNVMQLARQAALAAPALASTSLEKRNQTILQFAEILDRRRAEVLEANGKDALNKDAAEFKSGRMAIDNSKIDTVIAGCKALVAMRDPLGAIDYAKELDEGLRLYRVTCPIGVIGIIFEARPDVLPQIAALALKSGNAILLKGGQEVEHTNKVLFACLQEALKLEGLPESSAALLASRSDVAALLKADQYVDLIIPRGSNSLVSYIQSNTKIPVLGHAEGICHVFVHHSADIEQAIAVAVDAKCDYPEACNTMETLLLDKALTAEKQLAILTALHKAGVELKLDSALMTLCISGLNPKPPPELQTDLQSNLQTHLQANLQTHLQPKPAIYAAEEADWSREYSSLCLSAKIVDGVDEAIVHINQYGSGHTDAIICQDNQTWLKFFNGVKSAGVYHNASTRFADGFRYGFGAEVGISTSKLPPRGPVGLEGLVTYKYKIEGAGHKASDYHGAGAKSFRHTDIEKK
ncbi:MAG: glutamate-5-semialdehyde dehydrogenase [Cyanobacteria bacterium PR.023]|nr:glutamate-5-semialdehyde dehydrogenase [Cyanobacteria bacterium PR.023]